jgi:hypothetical protein
VELVPLAAQRFFALDFAAVGGEVAKQNGANMKEAMGTPAT